MEAKEFEKQIVNALNKLTSGDIRRIKNEIGVNTDYIIDKDGFTSEEEIKMIEFTQGEYDEYKDLKFSYDSLANDVEGTLHLITKTDCDYPLLQDRLFGNSSVEKDNSKQREFINALNHEDFVKIKKEPRYYLHLFPNSERGYINYDIDIDGISFDEKDDCEGIQTKFTEQEIYKLAEKKNQKGFKIEEITREKVEE